MFERAGKTYIWNKRKLTLARKDVHYYKRT